jgi:hypothetical protein
MKKKLNKQIRDIADRLPPVFEQHMSGGDFFEGKFTPNLYTVPVNHERRLRHAYEKLGMDGIRNYLDEIFKLQKERHEKAFGSNGDRESGVLPDVSEDLGTKDTVEPKNEDVSTAE